MKQRDARYAIDQLVIWAMAEARRQGAAAELRLEVLAGERVDPGHVPPGEANRPAA